MPLKNRLRTLRQKSKSIFDKEREKPKTLDLSGGRSRAFRKRKTSLLYKARLAGAKTRKPPFKKGLHSRRTYLKRRM